MGGGVVMRKTEIERVIQLADLDSNQDKQNQNLLCYRYTIGQVRRPGWRAIGEMRGTELRWGSRGEVLQRRGVQTARQAAGPDAGRPRGPRSASWQGRKALEAAARCRHVAMGPSLVKVGDKSRPPTGTWTFHQPRWESP